MNVEDFPGESTSIPELERIFIRIDDHRFLHKGDKLGWIVRHLNQVVGIDNEDVEKKENYHNDSMNEDKKNKNNNNAHHNNNYDNDDLLTTEENKKKEVGDNEKDDIDVEIESANICRRVETMRITRIVSRRCESKGDREDCSGEKPSTTPSPIMQGKLTGETDVVFYGASYNLVIQLDLNMFAMSVNSNNGEVLYMNLRNA